MSSLLLISFAAASLAVFWPAGSAPPAGQAANNPPLPVRHATQESFTVVGVTVRTNNAREAGGDGEIPKLWARAMQEGLLNSIPDRTDQNTIAVYSGYAGEENSDYDYTLGVRVTSAGNVPEGYVARTIAAGPYAVIRSEQGPPQQVVPAVWAHIWQLSPEELGGKRAFRTDYEVYAPGMTADNAQIDVYVGLKKE